LTCGFANPKIEKSHFKIADGLIMGSFRTTLSIIALTGG